MSRPSEPSASRTIQISMVSSSLPELLPELAREPRSGELAREPRSGGGDTRRRLGQRALLEQLHQEPERGKVPKMSATRLHAK